MRRRVAHILRVLLPGCFLIIELVMAAPATINSQATQMYQSTPMVFVVNTVPPEEQVQTTNVETEEEKMD